MEFGVSMFVTDQSAGPTEVAREAENRGFDSFWVSEHSHIPLSSLLFGIGAGWKEPEMQNHGTDPLRRFKLMRERSEAMKALWTQEGGISRGIVRDLVRT